MAAATSHRSCMARLLDRLPEALIRLPALIRCIQCMCLSRHTRCLAFAYCFPSSHGCFRVRPVDALSLAGTLLHFVLTLAAVSLQISRRWELCLASPSAAYWAWHLCCSSTPSSAPPGACRVRPDAFPGWLCLAVESEHRGRSTLGTYSNFWTGRVHRGGQKSLQAEQCAMQQAMLDLSGMHCPRL